MAVLFTCTMSCKKDVPIPAPICEAQRFYYYDLLKINVKETYNKGVISFYDTLSQGEIHKILDQYRNIHFSFPSDEAKVSFLIINIDSKSCAETESLFTSLKEDKRVSNCNKYLLTEDRYMVGLTHIFIGKLKNDSLITDMNELVDKTKTKMIRYDSLGGVYFFRADKFSEGDALDMANKFNESGIFKYAEPDFLGGAIID